MQTEKWCQIQIHMKCIKAIRMQGMQKTERWIRYEIARRDNLLQWDFEIGSMYLWFGWKCKSKSHNAKIIEIVNTKYMEIFHLNPAYFLPLLQPYTS